MVWPERGKWISVLFSKRALKSPAPSSPLATALLLKPEDPSASEIVVQLLLLLPDSSYQHFEYLLPCIPSLSLLCLSCSLSPTLSLHSSTSAWNFIAQPHSPEEYLSLCISRGCRYQKWEIRHLYSEPTAGDREPPDVSDHRIHTSLKLGHLKSRGRPARPNLINYSWGPPTFYSSSLLTAWSANTSIGGIQGYPRYDLFMLAEGYGLPFHTVNKLQIVIIVIQYNIHIIGNIFIRLPYK